MTKDIWTLTPTNEGHELDYRETFKGNRKQVERYAKEMQTRLQAAMRFGMIRVNVKSNSTDAEFIAE